MYGNTPEEDAQCLQATISAKEACTNKTGALCVFDYSATRDYTCVFHSGVGSGETDGNVTCSNLTTVEFCPAGHACVSGSPTNCKRGYYCPTGTAYPYDCPFGLLTCPEGLTDNPREGVLFFMLLFMFSIFLTLYWTLGRFFIRTGTTRRWERVAREATKKGAHDTLNESTMVHDQHVLVKTMDNIFQSMAARERAVATGKWNNILDEETVVRFSEDLSMSSVQMDVVPTGVLAASAASSVELPIPTPAPKTVSSKRASQPDASRMTIGGFGRRPSALAIRRKRETRESTTLMRTLEASMKNFEYEEVSTPMTVTFTHMSLTLKHTSVTVLSDVCVSIRPFHVTAIMGPSGAGKTSLLSLLRGQAHYADVLGEISINGHEVSSLEQFRCRTAFVPQDDIVCDELSIEENILYSALLFNRRGFLTSSEVMPMVLRAEKLLDIAHIRASVVGNATRRGISGGQKKRVSIGMELMKEAELFFLDEPTSGLDSASSMLVISALQFLASKGVTVCTTIHQPRQEILNLLDNLLLLAPGGRVAYFGPIVDVSAHFSRLSFTCPVGTNIADYVMDTLCGFVQMDDQDEVWEVKDTIAHICDWWSEHKYPDFRASTTSRGSMMKQQSDMESLIKIPNTSPAEEQWRYRLITQLMKVFCASFSRQAMTNYRTVDTIAITCGLLMLFGIVVAFLSGPLQLNGSTSGVSQFSSQITSGGLVFALLVQAANLRCLSSDQVLRDRELRAGLLIRPYYLGKILGNYIEAFLYAFAFLVGYYPFLKARASFEEYWYAFFLLHLAISGLVNFIVVAYPNDNKSTFSVGCVVLLWSFGGVAPPLDEMQKSMGTIATIVNGVSPFKYSYEIEIVNELSEYPTIWSVEDIYSKLDYHVSERNNRVIALFVYFVLANLCAYIWLETIYTKPRLVKNVKERIEVAVEKLKENIREYCSKFESKIQGDNNKEDSEHDDEEDFRMSTNMHRAPWDTLTSHLSNAKNPLQASSSVGSVGSGGGGNNSMNNSMNMSMELSPRISPSSSTAALV